MDNIFLSTVDNTKGALTVAKQNTGGTLVVELPALEMRRYIIHIEGTTPLLTNRPSDQVIEEIERGQTGQAKTKKLPRDPEAIFRNSYYQLPDGTPAFPASGLKEAVVLAGYRFGGESKTTVLRGAFSISMPRIPIIGPAPTMRRDFVIIPAAKMPTIAYRAQFDPWSMEIPVTLTEQFITIEQLVGLFRLAGMSIGIGAWRVEKKGLFGQFDVAKITPI